MNDKLLIDDDTFNDIYYLCINTLVGKLTKKGNKNKALKLYKKMKENIKLDTKKKIEISYIFLLFMLNSMPKVSFKEIRLGSQKKDIPIPINEKKQVLVSVDAVLKASKNKKKLEFDKLINYIIFTYQNKGIIIKNKQLKYKKAIINKMLLNIFIPKKQNLKEYNYVSEEANYQIYKDKTAL